MVPWALHPFIKGHWVHTWWLGDDHDVAGQPDITGRSTLEGDGRALEVVEHVHDRGEVKVLHAALAPLGQRQTKVLHGEEGEAQAVAPKGFELGGAPHLPWLYLGYALEVECEHILPTPGLALPYQEHSMSVRALQLNQLSCLHSGDRAVEPGVAGQEVICLLAGWV